MFNYINYFKSSLSFDSQKNIIRWKNNYYLITLYGKLRLKELSVHLKLAQASTPHNKKAGTLWSRILEVISGMPLRKAKMSGSTYHCTLL